LPRFFPPRRASARLLFCPRKRKRHHRADEISEEGRENERRLREKDESEARTSNLAERHFLSSRGGGFLILSPR
jgi:hypothetical protein